MNSNTFYFIDIETNSLEARTGQIKLIAYGKDGEPIETKKAVDTELENILKDKSVIKVFHNAKFDVGFFHQLGYEVCNYHCTMIMAQLLGEKKISLKDLSEKYLNIQVDKSLQHSDHWMNENITTGHLLYAKKDVECTRMLFNKLYQLIKERNLIDVYERERKTLPVIVMLNANGVRMKFHQWNCKLNEDRDLCLEIQNEVRELLQDHSLNLNSPKQIIEAFYKKCGIMLRSTSDDELAKYSEEFSSIKLLRKYRKLQANIKTYGDKLQSSIDDDGRIRAKWNLIGAVSGRMACSNPPIQGMPGKSREFFIPEEGHKLVCSDYSQVELRVLAEVSNDKTLLDYFKNRIDLHSGTASLVFKKPLNEVTKEDRQVAKSLNFGIVYGITSYGIQKNLKKAGLDTTLEQAEQYRAEFLKAYPKVRELQDNLLKANCIKTIGGRKWKSKDLTMTQRLNLPIQGSAAEGFKEALGLLVNQLKPSWKLVAVVHDEILLEVPDDETKEAKDILENCMITGMKKIIKNVPIVVETTIGDNWCK